MAVSDKAAWQTMQSKLMATGYTPNAIIGEPRSKMQSGTVAIIPNDGNIDETTLVGPREIHRVNLRMYRTWLEESQEEIEFLLDQFRADIAEDFFGDFNLGGNVAYALPVELAWHFDEATIENTVYRFLNIEVGYRIDDNATFVE
jgi:hypothetical protein